MHDMHCTMKSGAMPLETAKTLLGVDDLTDQNAIKRSFRQLVRILHPDQFSSNPELLDASTRLMADVNRAFETLRKENSSNNAKVSNDETNKPDFDTPKTNPEPFNLSKDPQRWTMSLRIFCHYGSLISLVATNGSLAGVLGAIICQLLASICKRDYIRLFAKKIKKVTPRPTQQLARHSFLWLLRTLHLRRE
jgi:curved DNA-binding protein CbpA